jgi:O-antigen/teichoic acid export membrane protein
MPNVDGFRLGQKTKYAIIDKSKSIFHWGIKGTWAVLDQSLFATANFGINILLARWLTPTEFGSFAIAFAFFTLVASLHTALLSEPMLVYGPGKYKDLFPDYLYSLLWMHWRLCGMFTLVAGTLGLALWILTGSQVALNILILALATPFILNQWLLRRATYIALQPKYAAYAGLLYILVVLTGFYVLQTNELITGYNAIVIMGFGSIISSILIAYKLGITKQTRPTNDFLKKCSSTHWEYGRWSLGVSVVSWVRNNVYLLLLPLWSSLGAAAAFKALIILIQPVGQIVTALSMVVLPALSASRESIRFKRILLFSGIFMLFITGLNWTFLVLYGGRLIEIVYAGQYVQYTRLLFIIGLLPLLSSVVTLAARGLQALDRPDRVFKADWWSTLIALPLGVILLFYFEINGAVIALVVSSGVALSFMTVLLFNEVRN